MLNKILECSAKGCTSSTIQIHRFPKDSERCRMWAERAGCLHLLENGIDTLHASYGLCADHFHETSYVMNNKQCLSVFALPEFFPEPPGPTNTTNVKELDTLCRTCACSSNDLVPVFDEKGIQLQLVDKIHTHLPIKVTPEDLLPITVCSSCIWKLGICHAFTLSCLEADAKLRTIFEAGSETEYIHPEEDKVFDQKEIDIEDVFTLQDASDEQTIQNNYIYDTGQTQSANNMFYLIDNVQETSTEECIKYDDNTSVTNLEVSSVNKQTAVLTDDADVTTTIEHEESAEQSVSSNEDDSIVILTNCKTIKKDTERDSSSKAGIVHTSIIMLNGASSLIQDNSNLKILVAEDVCNDKQIDLPQVSLFSEVRKMPEQQGNCQDILELKCSDEHLLNQSPLLNLPTLIVPTSDIKQNQQSPLELNNKVESLKNVSACKKKGRKQISKKSKSNIITSKISIKNMISAMQPVVVLERLKFLPDLKSRHNLKTLNIKYSDSKFIDHETDKPDINENADIDLKVENNIIQNKNVIDPSKIIESIDSIIKRNEEILQQTAAKKEKLPNPKIKSFPLNDPSQPTEHKYFKCLKCCAVHSTERLLHEHISSVHPVVYKCSMCKAEFSNFGRFQSHMKGHENKDEYVCEFCGQFFTHRHMLRKHQYSHMPQNYTCKECCKVFSNRNAYVKHLHCHREASYLCEVCGKSFKHFNNLNYHRRTCGDPGKIEQYICNVCGKNYRSRQNLKYHLRVHTNEKPYQCAKCGLCFRTAAQFRLHTLHHINARQHKCPVCGKGFNLRKLLRVHSLIHQRKYPCLVCGHTFTYFREFLEHRKNHTLEEISKANEYVQIKKVQQKKPEYLAKCTCQVCGKQLSNSNSLKCHMVIHSDEKPFECKICGKAFKAVWKLKLHSRIHSDNKPHICIICEKKFLTKAQLQSHHQTHSQQRFPCRHCNKSYSHKYSLVSHERKHSNDRSYKCEVCHKGFYSRKSICAHIRVHEDEKPFQCTYCQRSFKRNDILVAHVRTHTGERPFICSICGRGFKQNGDCRKHEQLHFKNVEQASITENNKIETVIK